MPRLRKPIKIPGLNRPHPWRDGEDPIPGLKDKPKSKPPPKDGDLIDPEDDDAAPCPDCISEPCHACIAEEE